MTPSALDAYTIRPSSHTTLLGAYLAVHGIPDALCVLHAATGCKVKTVRHVVEHDALADAHNRRRYSQLVDDDVISGSTAQLEEEIEQWTARRKAGLVVIPLSTPVRLQSRQLDDVIERAEARTGAHVVVIGDPGPASDLYTGFELTLRAVLERWEWPAADAPLRDDEIAIYGNLFDRYELDQVANVSELRKLLLALGLKARAVLTSGEPYATLATAVHARHHLLLPHAARLSPTLEARGCVPIATALPMGVGGTRRWLDQVAAAAGVPEARVSPIVNAELKRVRPLLDAARRRLAGKRVAVFADAPLAAGLLALLTEVEARPAVVGVLHRSPGGRADVERLLRQAGGEGLPADLVWLEDPLPREIEALVDPSGASDTSAVGHLDLAIGTATERALLAPHAPPFLELGFPSTGRHYLYPSPWLGFNGALRVLQELVHLEAR